MKISIGKVCISATKCRACPPSLNHRLHWAERARWNKEYKAEVWHAFWQNYPQLRARALPKSRAIITITIYAVKPPDPDNAYTCAKPLIDGMRGLVISDDTSNHIQLNVTAQKVDHRKDERVEIEVQE